MTYDAFGNILTVTDTRQHANRREQVYDESRNLAGCWVLFCVVRRMTPSMSPT